MYGSATAISNDDEQRQYQQQQQQQQQIHAVFTQQLICNPKLMLIQGR